MNRRERLADGRLVVWRPWVVTWYDADGDVLESRPLSDAELVELEAWQDGQPDAAYVRSVRARRAGEDAVWSSVKSVADLVAVLRSRRGV